MYKFSIKGHVGWSEEATERHVTSELKKAGGKDVEIEINSPGGYISEGVGMFNAISQYKGHVTTTNIGMAASMGSYLMMSGDTRKAYSNSTFMIHNALTFAYGNHIELRKTANILEGFSKMLSMEYVNVTGKSSGEIRQAMDDESYYFGDEIKEAGFVDEIIKSKNKKDSEKDKTESVAFAQYQFSELKNELKKNPESFQSLEKAAAFLPDFEKVTKDNSIQTSFTDSTSQIFGPASFNGNHPNDPKTELQNEINNQNSNSNQKPQESKIMDNLDQVFASNPLAKMQHDELVKKAVEAESKKKESELSARMEMVAPFLTAENIATYAPALNTLKGVMKGTVPSELFLDRIGEIDASLEKKKTKGAIEETNELDATPGEQVKAEASDEAGLNKEGNVVDVEKNNKFRLENGEE